METVIGYYTEIYIELSLDYIGDITYSKQHLYLTKSVITMAQCDL